MGYFPAPMISLIFFVASTLAAGTQVKRLDVGRVMSWYEYNGMAEEKGGRLPTASELREAGVRVEYDQWVPVIPENDDHQTGRRDGFVEDGSVNAWCNIGPRRYAIEFPLWGLDDNTYEWKKLNYFYFVELELNGEEYCEGEDMLRNAEACQASSCCHWNTWESGAASFYGAGRCWSDIGRDICHDRAAANDDSDDSSDDDSDDGSDDQSEDDDVMNGEEYCQGEDMLRNAEACQASSCCHWNTWESGMASFYGTGRCWSSIGQAICEDRADVHNDDDSDDQSEDDFDVMNGEEYCEGEDMLRNAEACQASSCCHWNTWEQGMASFYGAGRCWSSIGQAICEDRPNETEDGDHECDTMDQIKFWAMVSGYQRSIPDVRTYCSEFIVDSTNFDVTSPEYGEKSCACLNALFEEDIIPNDYAKTPKCYIMTEEGEKMWSEDYMKHMLDTSCDAPTADLCAPGVLQPDVEYFDKYSNETENCGDAVTYCSVPGNCDASTEELREYFTEMGCCSVAEEMECTESDKAKFFAMVGGYANFNSGVKMACGEFTEDYLKFDVEENKEPTCDCLETLYEEEILPNNYEKTPKCFVKTEEGKVMWTEDYLWTMMQSCEHEEDSDECTEEDKMEFFAMIGGYARFNMDVRETCGEFVRDNEKFDVEENTEPTCACLETLYEEEVIPNDYKKTPECYIKTEDGVMWVEDYLEHMMNFCHHADDESDDDSDDDSDESSEEDENLCNDEDKMEFFAMVGGYANFNTGVRSACYTFVVDYKKFDLEGEYAEETCGCLETLFEEEILPNNYVKTPECYAVTEEGEKIWAEDYLEHMLHACTGDEGSDEDESDESSDDQNESMEDDNECTKDHSAKFFAMVGGYARSDMAIRRLCGEFVRDYEKFDLDENREATCACLDTLYEESVIPNNYAKTPKCYVKTGEDEVMWSEDYLEHMMEECHDDDHEDDDDEHVMCTEHDGPEFDAKVEAYGSEKLKKACPPGDLPYMSKEYCQCRVELHEPENLLFTEETLPKCYLHKDGELVSLKDWLYADLLKCLEDGVVDPSVTPGPAPGDVLSKTETQALLKTVRKELKILENGELPNAKKNLKNMNQDISAAKKSLKRLAKKVSKKF